MSRLSTFERNLCDIHGEAIVTVTPHSSNGFLAGWTGPQKLGLWLLGLLVVIVFGLASLAALSLGGAVLWADLTARAQ